MTNLFHFHQIQQKTLVVYKLLQPSQLLQVSYPLVSNFLSDQITSNIRLPEHKAKQTGF